MEKMKEWFEEHPDMIILVPFGVMLLSLILTAASSEDSIAAMIFALIIISSIFVGIPTACAWILEAKNRSFWWLLLLFVFGIIGIIVIIMLEDRSEEVNYPTCEVEVRS
jgi:hypothetical protein